MSMLKLNTLYNLDCMIGMRDFPDKYFDLCICDPPYGINIDNSGRLVREKGFQNKGWDNIIPSDSYFNELFRVSMNQIIWGGNYFNLSPCRGFIIWDKLQPNNVSFANYEFAWTSFNVSAKKYVKRHNSDNRIHPTQKPIALYKWLLQNYAKPGDKILDTHAGSCSSVIACIDGGFDWIAFELDEDYYKAALQRINNHVRQFDIFNENKSNNIQATIF